MSGFDEENRDPRLPNESMFLMFCMFAFFSPFFVSMCLYVCEK
jgi:hypothetical protein